MEIKIALTMYVPGRDISGYLVRCGQNVVQGAATWASLGHWLDMHCLGAHPCRIGKL